MKKKVILFFLLLQLILVPIAFAQSLEITNGITYLTSTQNLDGSWGGTVTIINTDFYSTAVTVETLKILNETNTQAYINSIQWLNNYVTDNGGYIAWQILALSEENINLSTDLNLLLQRQNENGGWGGYLDFLSSNFHTALSLQALKAVNSSDLELISYALGYLISNQNTDGGWAFTPDDASAGSAQSSNVYMTALVLKVLSSYSSTFNVQSSIDNAVSYLLTNQNPDEGFGLDSSTVYETALTFLALVESDTDLSTVAQPAIDYLINNQQPNGSWEDDPYSTALALRALASVKPNLTISSSDITFSDSAPTVGETITAHCPTAERKRLCIWNNNLYSTNKFSKVSNFHAIIS